MTVWVIVAGMVVVGAAGLLDYISASPYLMAGIGAAAMLLLFLFYQSFRELGEPR